MKRNIFNICMVLLTIQATSLLASDSGQKSPTAGAIISADSAPTTSSLVAQPHRVSPTLQTQRDLQALADQPSDVDITTVTKQQGQPSSAAPTFTLDGTFPSATAVQSIAVSMGQQQLNGSNSKQTTQAGTMTSRRNNVSPLAIGIQRSSSPTSSSAATTTSSNEDFTSQQLNASARPKGKTATLISMFDRLSKTIERSNQENKKLRQKNEQLRTTQTDLYVQSLHDEIATLRDENDRLTTTLRPQQEQVASYSRSLVAAANTVTSNTAQPLDEVRAQLAITQRRLHIATFTAALATTLNIPAVRQGIANITDATLRRLATWNK